MFSFAGWSLYSSGCIVGRSQGVAVVINRFFSTAVNAAYGIAFQVNSATSFLSGSVIAAMNPQIMKSEGMGDRQRMLQLASTANKITLLLSCALVVPVACIIEPLLTLWLKEYPPATPLFCRVILITSVFDTLTYGLSSANQAIGRIRNYSLTINSIKLFTVPCLYFALCAGIELSYAIWIYAILELVGAICRIPFLKITAGLNVSKYMRDVHLRVAPSLIFLILAYLALQYFHLSLWLDILFAGIITAAYSWIIYKTALIGYEKEIMSNIFRTIRNKFLHLKTKIQ
jgi:O-antigen/teichoic acid export membrane protein